MRNKLYDEIENKRFFDFISKKDKTLKKEIDIIESSDIEWCPDDMLGDNADIVVFNENDCDKALHLIGRK